MFNKNSQFAFFGALLGGLSVCLGAFGAHALKQRLGPYELDIFHTATTYMMYQALFLLFLSTRKNSKIVKLNGILGTIGTVIFSGSLITLSFTGIKVLGAITPIGGLCIILAWFIQAFHEYKHLSKIKEGR